MAQFCCPVVVFSHWEGQAIGPAIVQHNKEVVAAKASHHVGNKMQ